MKKKISHIIFRRFIFVLFTLIIQIAFLIFLVAIPSIYFGYVSLILTVISIVVSIHVLDKNTKPAYKLIWIFLILLFPIFGGFMYMFFYLQANPRKFRRSMEQIISNSRKAFHLCPDRLKDLIDRHPEFKPQAFYLQEYAGFPLFSKTQTKCFDSGESFFKQVLIELEKAKNYIFLVGD